MTCRNCKRALRGAELTTEFELCMNCALVVLPRVLARVVPAETREEYAEYVPTILNEYYDEARRLRRIRQETGVVEVDPVPETISLA